MAESTLSEAYSSIRTKLGFYLGYGRDSGVWSQSSIDDIDQSIRAGLRYFYSPDIVGDNRYSHEWTFLQPIGTITTIVGTSKYTFPDNFGSIDGSFTYPEDQHYAPILIIPDDQLRNYKQTDLSTFPSFATIRPTFDATIGQRFEVEFYPTPSQIWIFEYRYLIIPEMIDAANPFPHGGALYSECLMQSCMAAAEFLMDDERGIHWQRFTELLATCISRDKKNSTPEHFGYNGDAGQGGMYGDGGDNYYRGNLYAKPASYNGIIYG